MTNEPWANKSDDEILQDMERARKRSFIKDTFYPALVEATMSVDEAGMLLQAIGSLIMSDAMHALHLKKMEEIRSYLIEKLTSEDDTRKFHLEEMLKHFDSMSLFEARGHMESMKAVIEQMKIDEMRTRNLTTLTPEWDKYLH